jgi:hypothetical protein
MMPTRLLSCRGLAIKAPGKPNAIPAKPVSLMNDLRLVLIYIVLYIQKYNP